MVDAEKTSSSRNNCIQRNLRGGWMGGDNRAEPWRILALRRLGARILDFQPAGLADFFKEVWQVAELWPLRGCGWKLNFKGTVLHNKDQSLGWHVLLYVSNVSQNLVSWTRGRLSR